MFKNAGARPHAATLGLHTLAPIRDVLWLMMFTLFFAMAWQRVGELFPPSSAGSDLETCFVMGMFCSLMLLISTTPSEYAEGFLFAPLRTVLIGIFAFQLVAFISFVRISPEAL